ncbi:MAG TPA: PAS domain S-box protein [Bacteroidales bacterium]|nr:PAS domain S-box protein [Bacteroidales bacterium]
MLPYLFIFYSFTAECLSVLLITCMLVLVTGYYLYYKIQKKNDLEQLLIYKRIISDTRLQSQYVVFQCRFDGERTLNYISENIFALTGYKRNALLGNQQISFNSLIHLDDQLRVLKAIQQSLNSEGVYQVDYRLHTKWGGEKWVKEQGQVRYGVNGQVELIEGVLADITDSRYIQDNAQNMEHRFQIFIENAPVGVCLCYNEIITYVNPVFLAMFGISSPDAILGASPLTLIAPYKREIFRFLIKDDESITQSEPGFASVGLKSDGTEFPLHAYFASVKECDFCGKLIFLIDTTEANQKEEALRESEEKARILLDTNTDIVVLMKSDYTILDCNQGFSGQFGKPRSELIGTNAMLLINDETDMYWIPWIMYVLKTGQTEHFEYQSNDGALFYNVTIYPVKNSEGTIESLVLYGHNTTQLKKAELALKEREEQYRTITESITDYVYKIIADYTGSRFIFLNKGCERILGYTQEEFKHNPALFVSMISDDDKPLFNSFLQRCIEQKTTRTIEFRMNHKNGKVVWVSNSIVFFKEKPNHVLEFNCVLKDITLNKHTEFALLEVEKRYRAVFDQSGLATNVFDLSGKLIMQNSLAASMLGGTPHNFIGKNLEEIARPDVAKGIRMAINETIHNKTLVNEAEIDLPAGKFWLKSTAHAIKNNSGDNIGVQFISQNITEKKEYEREMLNTIIETEERERMNFAQELHDGLGPLLSAIKIYTQWLARPDAKISQHEILTDMESLVNEASVAIKEISYKLSPHILENLGFIEAVKDFAEKLERSRNIKIDVETNFKKRLSKTSESVIYRVLCECINNTIKHAQASTIRIKIHKYQKKLKIQYADNGVGFNMDDVLNNKPGNGLYNMQNRVESINGYIVFNSQVGKGTKILIVVRL